MRGFIRAVCCLVVGLQVLIGVPLIVCVAFHLFLAGSVMGPVSVEYHSSQASSPVTIPPPNRIPAAVEEVEQHPVLQSRVERGSPLAGTVLEPNSAEEEQSLFVAALEKAAAEGSVGPANTPAIAPVQPQPVKDGREQANEFAIRQLYAMADRHEQSGDFERADQWRALARELREQASMNVTTDAGAPDTLSNLPATAGAPF